MMMRNVALVKKLRYPQTGGSNSYMCQTVGEMYTFFNVASRAVEDILEEISISNIKPAGRLSPLQERLI